MMLKRPSRDLTSWRWYYAVAPTRMDDGTWIWLEWFRARYVDAGNLDIIMRWQRHRTQQEDW